jgi:hypothetical protein
MKKRATTLLESGVNFTFLRVTATLIDFFLNNGPSIQKIQQFARTVERMPSANAAKVLQPNIITGLNGMIEGIGV